MFSVLELSTAAAHLQLSIDDSIGGSNDELSDKESALHIPLAVLILLVDDLP